MADDKNKVYYDTQDSKELPDDRSNRNSVAVWRTLALIAAFAAILLAIWMFIRDSADRRDREAITAEPVVVTPIPVTPVPTAVPTPIIVTEEPVPINGNIPTVVGSYGLDAQNYAVFWVQTQLRQTGQYYLRTANGAHWDITGSNGDHSMQEIQRFMRDRGYASDGSVSQTVIDAIVQYYNAIGKAMADVRKDGIYSYMSTIMSAGPGGSMATINKGESGNRVKWVQVCLNGCGYYSGPIDGNYGNSTDTAVKKFQRDHDLVERNYIKLGTARLLLEEYCRCGGALSTLP